MYRIWVDFNNFSAEDRIRFNTKGSIEDMKKMPELYEGMKVTVYDDEFEVDVMLTFVDGYWEGDLVSEYREIS